MRRQLDAVSYFINDVIDYDKRGANTEIKRFYVPHEGKFKMDVHYSKTLLNKLLSIEVRITFMPPSN